VNPDRESQPAAPDPTSNDALVEKYGAVGYAAQSNALSHPDRLATVATLHGLSPPGVASARVLEVGCSDGANLLPMAAGLPDARFVGCDLSPDAIELARGAVADTGLANVTFVEGDLRSLPDTLGAFDFIIAHGVYSWVPVAVRDALFALAAERLSPNGLLFVSYNVYPGCHIRRAVWDALHFHIRDIEAARERLDAARSLASALAQPGRVQSETDALLRREFGRVAATTDSALYHDDLAIPNEPVWFHEFAAHARAHGLAFVTEAKLFNSSSLGVASAMQPFVAERDRVEREQYLDFAVCRRFRQSVLCRAACEPALVWMPERAQSMHAAASLSLMRAAEQQRALLNPVRSALDADEAATLERVLGRLLEVAPRALPVAELESRFGGRAGGRTLAAMLADAFVADEILLHVHPPRLTEIARERPLASPVARWQVRRGVTVTNQEHEPMQIADAPPRALLALLDGGRDAKALDAAIGTALELDDPSARLRRIDQYVRQFARLGLLIA
jgi:SAM-dependent methyltransferase/methyltransferase-like protein